MKKMIIPTAIVAAVLAIMLGITTNLQTTNKATKLRFNDIGELATQEAYVTVVDTESKSQTIFGTKIPFTQTKYIYSYDAIVKAGINFSDIKYNVKSKEIEVIMPEIKIFSTELDLESLKVYHEQNNVFTKITMKEKNDNLKKLKETAKKTAIENGIKKQAKENAEKLIIQLFKQEYKNYEINFK